MSNKTKLPLTRHTLVDFLHAVYMIMSTAHQLGGAWAQLTNRLPVITSEW